MGFKLKKKGSSRVASEKSGVNFIATIQSKIEQFASLFGESEKSKPILYAALLCFVLALVSLAYLFYNVPRHNQLIRSLGELRLLSQTISKQATEATESGSQEAITKLQQSQKDFNENLLEIENIHGKSTDEYQKVQVMWTELSKNIDLISAHQKVLNQLYDTNISISETVPEIQAEYNLMVDQMARQGLPSSQVIIAKNQVFIAERILRSINSVLSGTDGNVSTSDFGVDIDTFGTYLNAELNGNAELGVDRIADPALRESLESIKSEYDKVLKSAAATVLKNGNQIVNVRQASSQIFSKSDVMLDNLGHLSDVARKNWLTLLLGAVLISSLAGLIFSVFKLITLRSVMDKQRVTRLQDEYDRNQNAILRLLDEIADLADGDLRSYATVSEDFTGAIADSINFAIDQLRDLVSRIHETSQEVARYTQDTQSITNQLAEASEHQAQEIAGASTAMNEMAQSIDQVSSNASESAEVAERSVQIASNGAQVVNRSIEGMDTIREQIQETSKRIKRLGESSQEIGNIVSLINDIADQTNILALNAAIQASMAGEAGRGFAVVADEVQRLAERSASATKQIETLVKTIQTDTNEAVISMEQTTTEVVRGANLAKDAGIALDEIQKVSGDLANLIASISDAAKLQSASASHIATTMTVVQEITSQTTTATFDTARSVSELANMAESLRESVTDFKLPD
ncbi:MULTISPECIES: methyl-accepting chemotaxis protein [Acinetobacter]|jgi:twitching motility protein PilJ|uniref:Methyl-accepting chemotaxis protein n=2 Tax=Acinetobacter pittii TaxID=48296 RepID=F0KN65_ACIP2|nr:MULTISPECIES: methyl-accepting chemotaxis protein [Acinetobacter]YP_004996532.1 methyl-accepting chemotaxis protein [Acinetobacter pittii PHEA-2]KCY60373.1 methyl-accepting chemotaxis (MCP) signaling domain protein [Acinetobacter baumannii 1288284]MDR0071270.1 methyl-accepting chemotaxis protein [Acinetobacter sp. 11520]QNB04586.1 methyl-accepting chemotaxis protein [Acinetobacter baumannii]ADY82850.1 methyl-accepting chemotaxis protein [Acinetobacter pittii PHEA-2]AMM27186.1 chemotaxis pr